MPRISIDVSGSWDKTERWLKKMASKGLEKTLHKIGSRGEKVLGVATPVGETGQTARGWRYKVEKDELSFNNVAHPEESVNIAKIKDLGHGTGTGGYVPGKHYIKPAMVPVWGMASKLIDEELRD